MTVPTDHEAMLAAVDELIPTVIAHRDSAEEARRPADEVIAQARDLGLFTLMAPAVRGGAELDLDTFLEVGLRLGMVDASHAWVVDFYIEHVLVLCHFPASFQAELFSSRPDVLTPIAISPNGRATPVPGGFVLDGRWQWGTGIAHAEWVVVGATVKGPTPQVRFLALPADQVTVVDTWYMDGMCATGSADLVIEDTFVPEDRTVDLGGLRDGRSPGADLHPGPLYRTPIAPILMLAAALPVLGQARFAAEEFARQLTRRYDSAGLEAQSQRSNRQARLAAAHLDVDAAEALVRRIVADVMAQRNQASDAARMRWAASLAHAVSMCCRAVSTVCDAAGAGSHRLDNPLRRVRQDVHTMSCHRVFDLDERHRSLGRSLLGLPTESHFH